jgi:glycosyltransferase involved in cell wall biosynthesis
MSNFDDMDIVCISSTSWEGTFVKSTVELIKNMAQRHRVLFVDYNYTCKDLLMSVLKKGSAPVKRMLGIQNRLQKTKAANDSALWILTLPPVFPVNFIKNRKLYVFFQKINVAIIRRSILKATQKLQFTHPVVINAWNPQIGIFLYQKLREKLTVYYCFDEISTGPWTKEHGAYFEKQLLQVVDACVVSSSGLYQTKAPLTRRCFVVNNGVNFDLFQSAYSFPKEQPVVIGFIGMIASRLDFQILEEIARRFPDAVLMLVGGVSFDGRSVDEEVARLKSYPNVRLTGVQPHEKLLNFLKSFHIGIIPNVKNTQTAAVYPMKINEYLAAGIPVVTTDFAPLDDFTGYVTVAHSADEFIQGIEQELKTDSDFKRKARQELARQNSWNNRAVEFEKIIEANLSLLQKT